MVEDREQDPFGLAVLAMLGAVLSILVSGFVFGVKNNLFHLPIIGMLYDEPQFRGDEFIQSLRFYAAGPFLILEGADRYIDPERLFQCLAVASRFIAFVGLLACATLLGIRTRRDRAIFVVVTAFSKFLAGSSYAGDGGLFVNYFTHTEIANGFSLLAIYYAARGRLIAAFAANGAVFFISYFTAAWNAVPLGIIIAFLLQQRRISPGQALGRGALGLLLFAALAAPVVRNILANPDFAMPLGFDYRVYLDQFWPFHFLFRSIPIRQKIALVMLFGTGVLAFLALGRRTILFQAALWGYGVVYLIGVALPALTGSAQLLNLHLLQSSSGIHLLTALGTSTLATTFLRNSDVTLSEVFGPFLVLTLCVSKAATLLSPLVILSYLIPAVRKRMPEFSPSPLIRYAVIASLCAVWPYAIWKQSQDSAAIKMDIAQWTAVGQWARATTPAEASFLVPTSDIRTDVGNSVQAGAVLGMEIFEYVSHRQVWMDFIRGAAVIWRPSYYETWRERLPELLLQHSLAEKLEYAASHGVQYVVNDCQVGHSEAAVFRTEKLCVFDSNAKGKSASQRP